MDEIFIQTCLHSALTENHFRHSSRHTNWMSVDLRDTMLPSTLKQPLIETRHDWRGNNGGICFHQSHQIRSTISLGEEEMMLF